MPLYAAMMHHRFVDSHCARLPGAERVQPFGPETVIWRVNGHMFAAYTGDGLGLSVRNRVLALPERLREARQEGGRAPELSTGDGWTIVGWDTPPEVLRARIDESYRLVLRDWPTRIPKPAPLDDESD
jgi:predicted DNA-binding protein (MmcQ/YjbR family)